MNRLALPILLIIAVAMPAFAGFNGPIQESIALAGGRSMNGVHGQVTIESLQFDFSRAFLPRTEFTWGFAPWLIEEPDHFLVAFGHGGTIHTKAVHLSIGVRHHFRDASANMRPYVEIGSGPMWSDKPIPVEASRFNFDSYGTAGVTFHARNGYAPYAGIRFQHISNGGYKADRNPGFNITAGVFGIRFVR